MLSQGSIYETVYVQVKDDVTVRHYLRLKLRGTSNFITLHEISDINTKALKLNVTKNRELLAVRLGLEVCQSMNWNSVKRSNSILKKGECKPLSTFSVHKNETTFR